MLLKHFKSGKKNVRFVKLVNKKGHGNEKHNREDWSGTGHGGKKKL